MSIDFILKVKIYESELYRIKRKLPFHILIALVVFCYRIFISFNKEFYKFFSIFMIFLTRIPHKILDNNYHS